MATQATHNDNITTNIVQAPLPSGDSKFTTVLYMREGIAFDGGTERIRTYASVDQANTDETAAEIDATTTAAITAALSQPGVTQVKVGRVLALESYPDALDAILLVDCEFWAIVMDVRTVADQLALILHLDSLANLSDGFRGRLFFQSSDSDWGTAGIATAYSTIAASPRWGVVFHDTDAQLDDIRWACARTAFDPDVRSAPWVGEITGGTGFATELTDTQKANLDANYANHVLPYGNVPRWIDGGWMGDGAFVYEALTTDWFHVRLATDISTRHAALTARGRKWPMDGEGRAMFGATIEKRMKLGVDGQHFKNGQTNVTVFPISTTDLSLGRIRAEGDATYLGSARLFDTGPLTFGREDVNPAA